MQLYTKILIGMIAGAILGLFFGPNSSLLPQDGVRATGGALVRVDATDDAAPHPFGAATRDYRLLETVGEGDEAWMHVEWTVTTAALLRLRTAGVPEAAEAAPGEVADGWLAEGGLDTQRYSRLGQRLVDWTAWIGDVFLALIKLVVVPLVFLSLLVGVASLGDFRKLGRIGSTTLIYFMGTTVMALVIGVGLGNIVRPGAILSEEDRAIMQAGAEGAAGATMQNAAAAPGFGEQIVSIIPTNPFQSLVAGDMLQIIFLALLFGIALTLMEAERAQPVVEIADRANDAVIMVVMIAMKLAPYGVAALLFEVAGTTGLSVLAALGIYSLVVIVGLLLQVFVVYGTVVRFGAKLPIFQFLGAIRPALLLAFSTSSSSATLPVTKQCIEDNLNVSQPVSSFVLPLGATINMDGTALYQGVAALFIAQIYAMDLGFAEQMTVVVTATLASIGAAGVPGAGMVTLAMVLTSVGVPTEGVALILGVDRLLDMFRTTTNVVGDATAAAFMARREGDALAIRTPAEDAADPTRGMEGRRLEQHKIPVDDA